MLKIDTKIRISERNQKFDFDFFSVLPIPLNPPFCKGGLVSPIYFDFAETEYLKRN